MSPVTVKVEYLDGDQVVARTFTAVDQEAAEQDATAWLDEHSVPQARVSVQTAGAPSDTTEQPSAEGVYHLTALLPFRYEVTYYDPSKKGNAGRTVSRWYRTLHDAALDLERLGIRPGKILHTREIENA